MPYRERGGAPNANANANAEANGQNGSKWEGGGSVSGPSWADGPAPGIGASASFRLARRVPVRAGRPMALSPGSSRSLHTRGGPGRLVPPSGPLIEERPSSSPRNVRESMPPDGHGGESAPQIASRSWVDPTHEQVSCFVLTRGHPLDCLWRCIISGGFGARFRGTDTSQEVCSLRIVGKPHGCSRSGANQS